MKSLESMWWLVLIPALAGCGAAASDEEGGAAATNDSAALKTPPKKKPTSPAASAPALASGGGSHQPLPIGNAYVDPKSATFTEATLYFSPPAGPRNVHVVIGQGGDPPSSYAAGA